MLTRLTSSGCCLLLLLWGACTVYAHQETIDGIVAVVNDDVLTLTDIKIAKAFGFYDEPGDSVDELSYLEILNRSIERKLIVALARQDLEVTSEEIVGWLIRISGNLEPGVLQEQLQNFDLTTEELGAYGEEVLLYRKIIDQRFSLTATVSLDEIETYYNQTYLPQQKERGEEAAPMMQILEEIETAVKAEKSQSLIEDWIQNMRMQAEIQLFTERYPDYFKLGNDLQNEYDSLGRG
jgi:hypothetical protein